MDITLTLTGVLPAILLISALLTAFVSFLLLRLYREKTLQGMAALSGKTRPVDQDPASPRLANQGTAIHIRYHDASTATALSPPETSEPPRRLSRSQTGALLTILLAGLAYALTFVAVMMVVADDGNYPLGRFLWLLLIYLWPTVIALNMLLAIGRRESLMIVGGYFLLAALIIPVMLARNPDLEAGQLLFVWLYTNLPPTLLFLTFLYHRIRGAGPLVLVFMLAGISGAMLLVQWLGSQDAILRGLTGITSLMGLDALATFLLMHLVGFILLALPGWYLLLQIGRRYQQKHFSDQSITQDALWLTFAITQSIPLAFEGGVWVLAGLIAFLLYKLVVMVGFATMRKRLPPEEYQAPMLLLLRVFSLGRRSEQFFDGFARLWRRMGSVSMIAGPDLVTASVEPHEFLAFVGGKHSRQFVKDKLDLDNRTASLDRMPDPDLRYRVSEFFCHDDTWRMSMQRLANLSDAILMDLRSFTPDNQGCLYELRYLIDHINLGKIVFLTDDTTDIPFLEHSVREAGLDMDVLSPNLRNAPPEMHIYRANDNNRTEIKNLVRLLTGPVSNKEL